MRRLGVILLLTVFLLTSVAAAKTSTDGNTPDAKRTATSKASLFGTSEDSYSSGSSYPVMMAAPMDYTPVGNWRQIYSVETTQHDRQHYTSSGRQIVYAGYWNANCDYVYMNWSARRVLGASIILQCLHGIFDWSAGTWDYTAGGSFQGGPSGNFANSPYTFAPNLDMTPDNNEMVAAMSIRNTAEAWKSYVAYGGPGCPTSSFQTAQTLPGPPNLEGITNGYCDENLGDETVSPYLWPILDCDTTDDGRVITHIAHQEWGFCDAATADQNNIDVASLIYQRKVATDADQPGTGTWDGPHFIDSVYNIAYIVRADHRPGNNNVYLAYMKPLYYKYDGSGTGGGHPCDNGPANAYYQLNQEIVYRLSTNDGASWGPVVKVTDYMSGFEDDKTQPAAYELTGFIDPNGTFHLAWMAPNIQDHCDLPYACKLYHWDNTNNCISLVYDASHPAAIPADALFPAWNRFIAKPNISYCDDKLYIVFTRFGAYTDPEDDDLADDIGATGFLNGDIYLTASDATGGMGQVWSAAVNITGTFTDECVTNECENEHYPTMAMYSTDSLMIEYILDLESGAVADPNDPNEATLTYTDNPVIFMTWPCFAMNELPQNNCISTTPADAEYDEVALAPNGDPTGCTTEGTYSNEVIISNCGNVNYSYTATSNDAWLTIDAGSGGTINAGTGPNFSDDPSWTGAPGCASPATIQWTASSATLGQGNYTGTISVDIAEAGVDDFDIVVNLVVACEYYTPEFAQITGGCWTIDLWNTPQAAHQGDAPDGNMKFYACGDTIAPLYHEAFVVGWKEGSTIRIYSDAITQDSTQYHMRALSSITTSEVGDPGNGVGYSKTEGYWSTPDSMVQGKIEYFVPGHQDTSVVIEKVTLWNTSGGALGDFILGEESDWDCDPDSSIDAGFIDTEYNMVYMTGDHVGTQNAAGLRVYNGSNSSYGARAVNGYDYAFSTLGWYPDTLYNKLQSISGNLSVFSDSTNGTEMRILNAFYGGTLNADDTLEICKVKTISLTGQSGLRELMDKGFAFIENYELCAAEIPCQGLCGDANDDQAVNVSDAVWIINYVFIGGAEPEPVLACGDANGDGAVNVSDAVWVINYVFIGGAAPGDCAPGSWDGNGGDCCAFE